ncbi:hypothetical protein ACFQO1_03525 [Jejudonia soesokkakensis]|uniref:YD repeat-containing protein n=1 Tax=Jejudonia soesokkakensis TaxID=1323432 RepID=A0ABW2MT61_9FLAO
MKTILITWLCFAWSTTVFSQYTINMEVAPLNTVPNKYTANQMGYVGAPKRVEKTSYGQTFVYHFHKDGRLQSIESPFYVKPSEYVYDSENRLIKNITYSKNGASVSLFTTNDQGFLWTDDITDASYKRYFEYNDSGLLCKVSEPEGLFTEYEYDSLGRVIKEIGNDYVNTYEYSKDRGFLKVTKTSKSKDYESAHNYYYNKQGVNVGNDKPGKPLDLPQSLVEVDATGNVTKITLGYGSVLEEAKFTYY